MKLKIKMKEYLNLIRIDKSIGTWLLFLPCLFGIALSSKSLFVEGHNLDLIYTTLLFFIGAFLTRAAGCVINDICDRNFDRSVKRTKNRPIAAGKISVINAIIFLVILLFLSLLVLMQFNLPTIILGFISLAFIASYPLMKRYTFYPQFFLGLTLNLGVLFASTAILGKITLVSFLLYLASVLWTVIYDTIYGYQDAEDDLKIGVKSTAIKFGQSPQKILYFLTINYFLILILLGWTANFQMAYYAMILLSAAHLSCQIKTCNFSDSQSCLRKFKSNFWVGVILLLAIILG